jgi:hypothetical protein
MLSSGFNSLKDGLGNLLHQKSEESLKEAIDRTVNSLKKKVEVQKQNKKASLESAGANKIQEETEKDGDPSLINQFKNKFGKPIKDVFKTKGGMVAAGAIAGAVVSFAAVTAISSAYAKAE